jgi:hypothetical protein
VRKSELADLIIRRVHDNELAPVLQMWQEAGVIEADNDKLGEEK